ncbi:hypothetical protein ACFQJ7_03720 [Halovenus rubra]|uniref:Uncharacterized protein n=2 Tax=Halovenus rubra TaxID=869890 RepID=A0ABD5X9S9_9EURY|nr:hypothetical protein [Halovenus rubra]
MNATLITELLMTVTSMPMKAYFDPWAIPPGVWVIFGVIGLPVYTAFLGWFLGKPRDLKTLALGSTLFLLFVSALWGGLFVTTMNIRLLFF